MKSEFENSIKCSASYEKLVYQHGERLFIFDDGKYKIAAVQLAWEIFKEQQSKVDELQKRVDALTLALDQIAYPIPHMQKEAELNGCELNGYWAVKMSEYHTYSKDIARRALEKEQALKGENK